MERYFGKIGKAVGCIVLVAAVFFELQVLYADDLYAHKIHTLIENGTGLDIEEGSAVGSIAEHSEKVSETVENGKKETFRTLAVSAMNTSADGISLIKEYEGCRLTAYKAVATETYYTIGYGHYGADVTKGMVITQQKAEELLKQDVAKFENAINTFLIANQIALQQCQFDALVSFSYNVGTKWVTDSSTLRTYLLNGLSNYSDDEIINAFSLWNSSGGSILPGLTRRRRKEAALFLNNPSLVNYKTGEYLIAASTLNVRSGPSTSYAKVVSGNSELVLKKSDVAVVTEISGYWGKYEKGWICLDYCRYVGAVSTDNTGSTGSTDNTGSIGSTDNTGNSGTTGSVENIQTEADSGSSTPEEITYEPGFYYVSKAETLNIRSGPDTTYSVVKVARLGEVYHITKTSGRFGKCSIGWLSLAYCDKYTLVKTSITAKANKAAGVSLTWKPVADASGYYIYRKKGTGSWTKVKTITSSKTVTYLDTSSMTEGTCYQYRIKAYRTVEGAACTSSYSAVKTTYWLAQTSFASVNTSASKKITLKWKKNSKATGYEIWYSTSKDFSSKDTVKKTISSNTTVTKTYTTTVSKKKVYVKIRAYKKVNETNYYAQWSSKASVTTK